jgi:hypothetical protein
MSFRARVSANRDVRSRIENPEIIDGGTAHKRVVLILVERGGMARCLRIDSTSIADIVPSGGKTRGVKASS